jgi:hypothetical protein
VVAPATARKPISTNEPVAVFHPGAPARRHRDRAAGNGSDLDHLALMLYLGLKETKRWAESADPVPRQRYGDVRLRTHKFRQIGPFA